jgi:hypothetical protein
VLSSATCSAPGGDAPVDVYYGWAPEDILSPTAPVEPYTGQPYDNATAAPPSPAQSTVEQAIEDELEKPENHIVRDWLNYQLGSPGAEDPTGVGAPNPVVVPSPVPGETVVEFAARLDELGLSISVSELEEADPARKPSEVVSVDPEPGTKVETGREVAVRVNRAKDCDTPLFHYTSLKAAAGIVAQSAIVSSAANGPYPSGAYATTISPLQALARYTYQDELAWHLFSEAERPVSWWLELCADENPSFGPTPNVPPERLDFWNAPAPPNVPVPIVIAGAGPNPLIRGF